MSYNCEDYDYKGYRYYETKDMSYDDNGCAQQFDHDADSGCPHLSDHFNINDDHNPAPSDFDYYQQDTEFKNNRTGTEWDPKVDEQEWQDCQHEGFKENELWELEGGEHNGYKPWELEYGRDEIGVGEHEPKGPKFEEQEDQEPKNAENQPQGLGFDPGSETQCRYTHPTSHTLPTMFDSNKVDEYLTAYPNPTSPFAYDDIATLHCNHENGVPEAIKYMRAMNKLSDKCMADNEDYQLYCRENEERRCIALPPL